ncbi:MAG: FGGY-family carbohydrate kinase [Bacillota bacterium]
MSKKYLIGIDVGTQSSKVIVFDLEGNIVCEGKRPLRPCVAEKPGYSEHPDDDLWNTFLVTAREVVEKFPGDLNDILGIGLCTIRSCRTFLKEDGTLARPVMSWFDSRAFGPIEAGDDVSYVTTTTGYFTHRLTGNFSDTVSNNTEAQWPVDPYTWDWTDDPQKYIKFHIARKRLVSLQMPGTILGYLTKEAAAATGFPEGLPIVATANDKAVESLGAGLMGSDLGLVSLGTYIASMINGKRYIENTKTFFCNFGCVPNLYLYESNGIWRGMWTISWLINLLGDEVKLKADALGVSPEEFLSDEAAKVPAGSEGLLTVLEWLAFESHKKGTIIGFDVRHTRGHMFRSIMEGIAMTMKNNYQAMCDEVGQYPKKIILSGGGSSSDVFVQIFADVFGVPVVRNVMNGAAGLGSAICAAVATGAYASFDEAVKHMVKIRDVFEPNMKNHRLYTKINAEVYSKISPETDGLLRTLEKILAE